MSTTNKHPLSWLDSQQSRAYAADYAVTTGLSTREALDAIRHVDLARLEAAVDLWVAKNRFKLVGVRTNELGINIVVNTPGMEDMLEKAPFSFGDILRAFDFDGTGFMIHNEATGEFLFF